MLGNFGKPAKLLPGCRHCFSDWSPSGKDPASFACFWAALLFGFCHSYFLYISISFTRPIKWLLGFRLADAVDGFMQRSQHRLLCKKWRERGGVREPGSGVQWGQKEKGQKSWRANITLEIQLTTLNQNISLWYRRAPEEPTEICCRSQVLPACLPDNCLSTYRAVLSPWGTGTNQSAWPSRVSEWLLSYAQITTQLSQSQSVLLPLCFSGHLESSGSSLRKGRTLLDEWGLFPYS